jgi:hypothetical protein
MKHSLINGESVEYVLLSSHSPNLDNVDYRYGVKFYDLSGKVIWQGQITFHETPSMRRRNRYIKPVAPERIMAWLRTEPELVWDDDVQMGDRMEAIEELATHLSRQRRKV